MMETIRLSEHFYLRDLIQSETASRLRIKSQFNPPVAVINQLSNLAIHVLDPVHEKFGRVKITSGYRCKELNDHVKGVPNSQHIAGQAVDIWHENLDEVYRWLKTRVFDQLIKYDTFIHVSYCVTRNRNMIIDKTSNTKM